MITDGKTPAKRPKKRNVLGYGLGRCSLNRPGKVRLSFPDLAYLSANEPFGLEID